MRPSRFRGADQSRYTLGLICAVLSDKPCDALTQNLRPHIGWGRNDASTARVFFW